MIKDALKTIEKSIVQLEELHVDLLKLHLQLEDVLNGGNSSLRQKVVEKADFENKAFQSMINEGGMEEKPI